MASVKTWSSPSNGYQFRVTLTQNASSGSNNYSTLTWKLEHYQGWTTYNGAMTRYLKLDTSVKNYSVYGTYTGDYDTTVQAYNAWWTVANSTSGVVNHDSNGNKTVNSHFYWAGTSGIFGPGTVDQSWSFVLARIPLAPFGLSQSVIATGATTASVNLDISNRGHGSTALHELQYRKTGDSTWIGTPDQSITDTLTNTFNLASLDAATQYDYRQKVWNNYSDTAYSTAGTFTTLGYAVINTYTRTPVTDTSIQANVVTDVTCDLLEYKLDGASYVTAFSGDYTSKDFTLSDLISDNTYTLQVRVRRKDSQLLTESSVEDVTTEGQNNFLGFKLGK